MLGFQSYTSNTHSNEIGNTMKSKTARFWNIAANTATVIAMISIIAASITVFVTNTNNYSNILLPIAIVLVLPVFLVDYTKMFFKLIAWLFSKRVA